ncbi:NAD(P)/FAD-dependent oxidoreductase [uncultured Dokdonia sp.]|uniref:flavin monoamine oxidase family protein n=1 Tax=uncultured Dokdonia sp. TaxID=575653 RepID=UPI0026262058|nr:NAD(P)/FAD-dependent oxidoreductase [uncultured Dokdonia sp.]
MKKNILIIGAGLTGLLLAYRLKKQGIPVTVLEARDRIGGRIHTHLSDRETPIEMGATWLGQQHTALIELLQELQIPIYPQYTEGTAWYEPMANQAPQEVMLPSNGSPSYRIQGGSSALIEQLAQALEKDELYLNTSVTHIKAHDNVIEVITKDQTYTASKVVSTLPPNLLVTDIQFSPELPDTLTSIAKKTHTWMGESIKFGISYPTPFWKKRNWSGTLYSNVFPITEMYDHTTLENGKYALKGFLNNELSTVTREIRKENVFAQLQRTFGEEALNYLSYKETVWKEEAFTFTPYENFVFPHQNNGQAIYQELFYNDRFYVAGSETASQFGGYMEGAVQSAQKCFEHIIKISFV